MVAVRVKPAGQLLGYRRYGQSATSSWQYYQDTGGEEREISPSVGMIDLARRLPSRPPRPLPGVWMPYVFTTPKAYSGALTFQRRP